MERSHRRAAERIEEDDGDDVSISVSNEPSTAAATETRSRRDAVFDRVLTIFLFCFDFIVFYRPPPPRRPA